MAVEVTCGQCRHAWKAGDAARGMRMACPKCRAEVSIPGGDGTGNTPTPRIARGSQWTPSTTLGPAPTRTAGTGPAIARPAFTLNHNQFMSWLRLRGVPDMRVVEVVELAGQLLLRTGGELDDNAVGAACNRAVAEGRDQRFVSQLLQIAVTLRRFRDDVLTVRA